MASIYEQVPIRLQIGVTSNPPVEPLDANTGNAPRFWRGQAISVQGGIFDANGNPVDLSNVAYVEVILQKAVDSIVQLARVQVDAEDITATITLGAWRAGTAQNFAAAFSAAQTDQGLEGGNSAAFWLIVRGVTDQDAPIVYSAGPVSIYNPGSTLPSPATAKVVSRNAQTTTVDDVTVTPASQIHTEVVTVEGDARDFDVLLGISGIEDGAQLALILILPETADIVASVKNALTSNPTISTVSTGSVLKALLEYYFDADLSAWVPKFYALPPT